MAIAQVGEGDLQAVDHGAQAVVLDLAGESGAHQLAENRLDRGAVGERRNIAYGHAAAGLALVEVAACPMFAPCFSALTWEKALPPAFRLLPPAPCPLLSSRAQRGICF
ncbi:MAG: hypothetical protein ACREOH_04830 [Candidatus Entotheonellia bacterium]